MQISHKLTQILLGLAALIALCAISFAQQTDSVVQVSDQKAGSVLVYPYYASGAAGSGTGDTRLTISNVGPTAPLGGPNGAADSPQTVAVHLFFLDASCAQADVFACLTPNASISFKASDYDPFTTRGALYTVVVDNQGYPIAYNGLIGNAFVNYTDAAGRQYVDNYGAEAFFGRGQQVAGGGNNYYTDFNSPAAPSSFALLFFDGSPSTPGVMRGYDAAPTAFAVEIQSPLDATDQTIVTVGLAGDIAGGVIGAAQIGVGTIVNGNERPFGSFTGFVAGCSGVQIITNSFPRVPLGVNGVIPSGQVGTLSWKVGGAVGLILTPQRVGQKANAWSGIRTLHKTSVTPNIPIFNAGLNLRVPVITPVC